jgi:hypothetical protein
MQIIVDRYLAIIGTALTAVSSFWPVNIAMSRGSSEYVKLFLGLLDGKKFGKNYSSKIGRCGTCRKPNQNVDKLVLLYISQ